MDRCRAFRGWNEAEAKKHLLSHVGDFYNDVKDIFFKDVWHGLRSRAGQVTDEAADKVADALDETGSVIDNFVRTPVKAVTATSQAVYGTTTKSVSFVGNLLTKPFKKKQ